MKTEGKCYSGLNLFEICGGIVVFLEKIQKTTENCNNLTLFILKNIVK